MAASMSGTALYNRCTERPSCSYIQADHHCSARPCRAGPSLLSQQSMPARQLQRKKISASRKAASRSSDLVVKAASKDSSGIQPPYRIVITGSTKGVGKALAAEFLKAGDTVLISSRSDDRVRSTVRELSQAPGTTGRVKGQACNVAKASDVAALAQAAANEMGGVDIWINNAGSNAYKYGSLTDASDADLVQIVETNVLGTILGCREAIKTMREQSGGGLIFNMDGAGADGNATPRFAAYGATKRSLAQLAKSLQAELKIQGVSKVGIHNLSPGMVTTDLLMSGADTKVSKWFINALAEPAETVAEYLVPRIRKAPQESKAFKGGVYLRYLTKPKAYGQIALKLLLGQRNNRYVQEE